MRLRHFGLVALAALALAGCGAADGSDPVGAPPSTAAAPSSPSPSAPSVAPTSPESAPPPGSAAPSRPTAGAITVTGQVRDGVEPGCVLLAVGDKSYLLLGGDRAKLRSGTTLTVTGVPQPNMLSTCQQGTPLQVVSIKEG
ncbi:hypothetical protein GCM10010399_66140 [Dactylosporangium fulvum]|uniref:Lipoprotein n=1 Tax=Dactylosporangium fulvum TaxID=53359 RepID=A0ABY5VV18_9ACTN|nr:hypothetical protein [Dactylosporangium fulvum]UWP81638.1 hypothetical protein Dfulv_42075 [Dactylosporangium fulvum]